MLAQHLGDGQDQVSGGRALRQRAGELEADHPGDEHADRLAQHGGLGLDAADAPPEHAEPVDHGGVRVGAEQGVGIGLPVLRREDHTGQVLEVDLMADAGVGRHHPEGVEGALAPAQEPVAFLVALELQLGVASVGVAGAVHVSDDRVVDDQLSRYERIHPVRIAPQLRHGVAHGRQIDHGGHTGEVLHEDAGRGEGDLLAGLSIRVPFSQGHDIPGVDSDAVLVAEHVLQEHLERVGQTAGVGYGVDAVDLIAAVANLQLGAGPEAVAAVVAVARHGAIPPGHRWATPSLAHRIPPPSRRRAGAG